MQSILFAAPSSMRAAATAPLAANNRRPSGSGDRLRVAMRSKPKDEEHFEPPEPRGECLLADARDAMEACKNLPPEDEAACMLALGCDAQAVHARLDGEEEEDAKEGTAATTEAAKK